MTMLPHSPDGRRRSIAALLLACVFILLLTACRTTPTPVATAVATATPTAPATAAAPSIVARRAVATVQPTRSTPHKTTPLIALTGAAALPPFTIPLPADWQHVILDRQRSAEQLQLVGAANAALVPLIERLLDRPESDLTLLVAWPAGQQQGSGLVAYAIPRRDLSLQRYLTAAEQAIRSTATVTLHEAVVSYTVRMDVPVGYLHYKLAAQEANGQDRKEVAGHHYLLFDEEATQLLLLTFVTHSTIDTAVSAATATPAAAISISTARLSATATPPPFADMVQGVRRQEDSETVGQ